VAENGEFHGEITVKSHIVDYLSSGLYDHPAACLKELVNNSYDADASSVRIYVKPDARQIIIEDDGSGMDQPEFIRNFSVISESTKRLESDRTALGRPKIGRIGIGFIAANELCDTMQLISTKQGSTERLDVQIRFEMMRRDPSERTRSDDRLAKADYVGTVYSDEESDTHYTYILLKDVREETQEIVAHSGRSPQATGSMSLYGMAPETAADLLRRTRPRTWKEFDTYTQTMLRVALNVPVAYHDRWLPKHLASELSAFSKAVEQLRFDVYYDASEIRKPVVLAPASDSIGQIVERVSLEGEHISASGYLYAQHKAIHPIELQGLLIRVRNAAVGEYDPTFMGFTRTIGPLFQDWISGEINADDRLEDAMNIDRKTFRVNHPAFVELQQLVHKKLESFIARVRSELYASGRASRQTEKARDVEKRVARVVSQALSNQKPAVVRKLQESWQKAISDEARKKSLLQKYTVDELYEIVLDVAKDILSEKQLEAFVTQLTYRLQK
jgi:hypothetical protein